MKNFHILIPLLLHTFFLLSCSLSLVLSFSLPQTNPQNHCLANQKSALVQLHHGLYYAQNFTLSSRFDLWDLNSDYCSWNGITCDAFGHVIGLDLSYMNLSGSFHSIFNLHHLQRLNLAGNNFNTTLFQYEFDRLPNITHLNLSNSCFHGQIPMGISYLKRLVSLDLSNQDSCYQRYQKIIDPYNAIYFYHPVPSEFYQHLKLEDPNFKTLIKNLRSLTELFLDSVNISTQSTKWCETTSIVLPRLRVLSLSNCNLKGPFCSSLSRLHFLSKLFLDGNPITYLPFNFLEISTRLVSLSLKNCNLSGHFPVEILLLPKIQSINISYNDHLTGELPEFPLNNSFQILSISHTNFSGKLPESIGNLKFLTTLDLGFCKFSGQIPSSVANLTNLVKLDLSANNFNGSIPPFHGFGVPNLAHLILDWNQLSGPIHSSLFALPSLQTLRLTGNKLVGEIGEFPNASYSLLKSLSFSNNSLNGSIPKSIFQLSKLESLYIGYNKFDSPKIDMFCQLKNLRCLSLSNMSLLIGSDNKSLIFPQLEALFIRSCNLTEFPEFIKTQAKLVYLDFSFNTIDFSKKIPFGDANSFFPMLRYLDLRYCNISAFPVFLMSQENLEFLLLSNNKISGTVPNWVWKKSLRSLDLSNNSLSYLNHFPLNYHSPSSSGGSLSRPICNLSRLWRFNASYNKLSGPIPSCLGNINTLKLLDLHENNFSGGIPDFANCTELRVLNLGNNSLYDTFPFWLGKLPKLVVLILRANRLYGPIKYVKNGFPMLDVLDIALNDFSGQLPTEFFQAPQLRSLKMSGNKLEGKLPRSLVNCTKLEVLDMGNNMFHDAFPFWSVKLPFLKVLVRRANLFYGTIKLPKDRNTFPMLRILDLASNNFSGEPSGEFFQSLRAMMVMTDEDKANRKYIGDDNYQDSVTIFFKGLEIVFEKILTTLTCLDLSNNSFHGIIPEEIRKLTSLIVLNLSQNSFSGQIPLALVNLKELESLDLSQNNLSGEIPPQLTTLTFLSALNLSYNQLEGSIPQSNQFGTFSNDSYKGNRGLCGPPLTKRCNEADDVPMAPPGEDADSWVDDISVWKIVLMGYASGLVIGLSIGFTVLNEMGNKWLDIYKRNRKRNGRR
ncbi:hypothetical protein PTKIN_Ptkin09bG0237100 [Pterospermum kingtungense]